MHTRLAIALGLALIATDAAQASFAATNTIYYPSGVSEYNAPSNLARADVKKDTVVANNSMHMPRTEFGAGSHDKSGSTMTRAEVKTQARTVEQPQSRTYFSY